MDNVSRFVAQIQANVRDFERKIKRAVATAQTLPDEIEVNVDVDISKFRRGLLRAQALAQRFSARNIVKNVVVRFGRSRQRIRNFITEVDDMNENFQREFIRLAKMISAIGVVISNVIGGFLIGSFMALVPIIAGATSAIMALGNALGVTVGNVLAFVGALGVAGLGVAAYGGLVASVLQRYNDEAFEATEASNRFTEALDGIKSAWNGIVDMHEDAIFTQMATAIDTANFALNEMTPFIDNVVGAMGRMTNELQTFVQESPTMIRFFDNMNTKGSDVFENLVRGIGRFGQGIIDTMNAAFPLIEWVAQGFNNLGEQFADWANRMAETNGFHDFINYVQENMPKIGKIFGDFFLGVINLFAAFGENSSTVLDGLQDMMARFREWSETIKQSDGFQQFIDYIQQHGPTVISLIGNIVMTLVNFGIAIAPLAGKVLEVVNAVFAFTNELFRSNPIVGQIIGVLISLFGAFKILAPLILVVTQVIVPFIGMLVRLFTQSMLVKGAIALLKGVFTLLSGPVGIAIGALTALSAIFIVLYDNVEWFRNAVDAAWSFITNFISTQVQTIIGWFNYFRDEGNNIFNSAMLAITTTIAQGLIEAALAFTAWISGVLAQIVGFGVSLATNIISALTQFISAIAMKLVEGSLAFTNWFASVIASVVAFGANLVSTIVSAIASFTTSIVTGLASALAAFTSFVASGIAAIVTFAAGIVSNIISAMTSFVSTIASGLASAFSSISSFVASGISAIVSFVSSVVSSIASGMASFVSSIASGTASAISAISSFVSSAISSIVSFVSSLISNISSGMSSFVSTISSGASSAMSTISSFVSSAISAIVNFVSQIVSNITSGMANFVSAIVSGGSNAVSAVSTMGSNIVSTVGSFVGQMVSAGADLIRGLVNGIKSMASSAISAAKGVVGDAVAGAKNLLGINSPSRVFRSFGEYTMQGLAIGIQRDADKAIGAVTNVAKDMTNSFAPDLTTTADIDSQIGSINQNIKHSVQDDIERGIDINSNANINLNLGNRAYRGFAEDINDENTRVTNLEETYLGGAY